MKNYYNIEGIEYVRVSTILSLLNKEALIQWAVNVSLEYVKKNIHNQDVNDLVKSAKYKYKEKSEEAMNIGSSVHDIIMYYVKAKINNISFDPTQFQKFNDQVENGFLAFLEWESKNNVIWIKSEKLLYHPKLFYAGTCDAICMINGKKTIIDFKTSSGFYDGYDLQLSAYLLAYRQFEKDIYNIGILRLDKETAIPEYKDYTKKYNADAFSMLVAFYYFWKKRRLKNPMTR